MKKRVFLVVLVVSMCMITACGEKDNKVTNTETTTKEEKVDETVIEGDIRPEFKQQVDYYEKYFFDYVEARKIQIVAQEAGDIDEVIALNEEYSELFGEYASAMRGYTEIGQVEMTDDEREYWVASSKRITEKLKEALPDDNGENE